jgi:hypothetical protein
MEPKPHLDQSTQEEQIREALNTHWRASAVGDANAEHDIYDDQVICDYPQSGERILGRSNLQARGVIIPASRPASTSRGFSETGISGSRNIQSRTRGDWHTRWALWSFATARSSTKHSISEIPSRRRLGGGKGFSRSRDAALRMRKFARPIAGHWPGSEFPFGRAFRFR